MPFDRPGAPSPRGGRQRNELAKKVYVRILLAAMQPAFTLVGPLENIRTVAVGRRIRCAARLIKLYGSGRWRKMKGVAVIRLSSGECRVAELHWYEAHGIGRVEIKRKRYIS